MEFRHGLVSAPGLYGKSAHEGLLLFRGKTGVKILDGYQFILQNAVQRRSRFLTGETAVDRGGQGVDIRLGALPFSLVLLNGGEALFQGNRHGEISARRPGTSEVHQANRSMFQHQVVRGDVPMQQALFVHGPQGFKQGLQHREQFLRGQPASLLPDPVLKTDPVHIFHHKIAGGVFLKEVPHRHNLGLFLHPGQDAGFFQKALQPLLVPLGLPCTQTGDHPERVRTVSDNRLCRVVLLHRHPEIQPQIPADVCDSEAPFSQYPADQVSVMEYRSRGQVVGLGRIGRIRRPAGLAGLTGSNGIHTVTAIASIIEQNAV